MKRVVLFFWVFTDFAFQSTPTFVAELENYNGTPDILLKNTSSLQKYDFSGGILSICKDKLADPSLIYGLYLDKKDEIMELDLNGKNTNLKVSGLGTENKSCDINVLSTPCASHNTYNLQNIHFGRLNAISEFISKLIIGVENRKGPFSYSYKANTQKTSFPVEIQNRKSILAKNKPKACYFNFVPLEKNKKINVTLNKKRVKRVTSTRNKNLFYAKKKLTNEICLAKHRKIGYKLKISQDITKKEILCNGSSAIEDVSFVILPEKEDRKLKTCKNELLNAEKPTLHEKSKDPVVSNFIEKKSKQIFDPSDETYHLYSERFNKSEFADIKGPRILLNEKQTEYIVQHPTNKNRPEKNFTWFVSGAKKNVLKELILWHENIFYEKKYGAVTKTANELSNMCILYNWLIGGFETTVLCSSILFSHLSTGKKYIDAIKIIFVNLLSTNVLFNKRQTTFDIIESIHNGCNIEQETLRNIYFLTNYTSQEEFSKMVAEILCIINILSSNKYEKVIYLFSPEMSFLTKGSVIFLEKNRLYSDRLLVTLHYLIKLQCQLDIILIYIKAAQIFVCDQPIKLVLFYLPDFIC
jgi:hypothetical protein